MPEGLQLFSDAGVTTLDTSNRIARVLGVLSFSGGGTLTVPKLANERVFYQAIAIGGGTVTVNLVNPLSPSVATADGTRLDYAVSSGSGVLIYGVH